MKREAILFVLAFVLVFLFPLSSWQKSKEPTYEVIASWEFMQKAQRFGHHWDLFARKLAGCPEKGIIIDSDNECDPARSRLDYGLFVKLREDAKKLFELEECK